MEINLMIGVAVVCDSEVGPRRKLPDRGWISVTVTPLLVTYSGPLPVLLPWQGCGARS
jgi:hypothetical protein